MPQYRRSRMPWRGCDNLGVTPPGLCTHRRRRAICALLLGGGLGLSARASVSVEGVALAPRLSLFGVDLVLNGTGIRSVAWIKGYLAALYVAQRSAQPQVLIHQGGPKRLRLHLLMDVPATEFSKALEKGVLRNTPQLEQPGLMARLQRLEQLISALGTVRKGDVVDLDFDPGRGLGLSLNGTLRGEFLAGADLYAAVLRSFLGELPYDKALRAGLLGSAT